MQGKAKSLSLACLQMIIFPPQGKQMLSFSCLLVLPEIFYLCTSYYITFYKTFQFHLSSPSPRPT
jgi:hypothetical protein